MEFKTIMNFSEGDLKVFKHFTLEVFKGPISTEFDLINNDNRKIRINIKYDLANYLLESMLFFKSDIHQLYGKLKTYEYSGITNWDVIQSPNNIHLEVASLIRELKIILLDL